MEDFQVLRERGEERDPRERRRRCPGSGMRMGARFDRPGCQYAVQNSPKTPNLGESCVQAAIRVMRDLLGTAVKQLMPRKATRSNEGGASVHMDICIRQGWQLITADRQAYMLDGSLDEPMTRWTGAQSTVAHSVHSYGDCAKLKCAKGAKSATPDDLT